jgi:hypothetical protein
MAEEFIDEKTPEDAKISRERVKREREFELEGLKTEEELDEEKKKKIKKQRFLEWFILILVGVSLGILALFLL